MQLGRRSDSLFSGDYQSVVRGRGMEFEEVRSYEPGDDIRHIVGTSRRGRRAYTKLFREERQVTVMLVVDVSGSTQTGSGGRDGCTDRRPQIAHCRGLAFPRRATEIMWGCHAHGPCGRGRATPSFEGHAWAIIRRFSVGSPPVAVPICLRHFSIFTAYRDVGAW